MKSLMKISDQAGQDSSDSSLPHYLFVDDDIFMRNLFKSFFERKAEVSLANDGREALLKIAGQHFDAIISDVDMPTLNGIGLFKILSVIDASICKRFLFCSGNFSPELSAFCSEHQVPFFSKPIRLTALQAELDELINIDFEQNTYPRTAS